MALALLLAAFAGGAAGLVWNWISSASGPAKMETATTPPPNTSPGG
jgi:ferric-dicitrate binding protein FerR (iron transport regulator)